MHIRPIISGIFGILALLIGILALIFAWYIPQSFRTTSKDDSNSSCTGGTLVSWFHQKNWCECSNSAWCSLLNIDDETHNWWDGCDSQSCDRLKLVYSLSLGLTLLSLVFVLLSTVVTLLRGFCKLFHKTAGKLCVIFGYFLSIIFAIAAICVFLLITWAYKEDPVCSNIANLFNFGPCEKFVGYEDADVLGTEVQSYFGPGPGWILEAVSIGFLLFALIFACISPGHHHGYTSLE